jgi:mannose-6-phosphate isomerase-like protein (cupin superfamily)
MNRYVVNTDEVGVGRITGREIRDLINEKTVGAKSISLRITDVFPGETTYPGHTHTECEEIILLLSGEGQIKILDEVFRIKQGDAVFLPRGVKHLIRNTGKQPMRLACSFSSPDMSRDLQNENSMDF